MRKPVFPRILLLTLLYCAAFIVLVSMQFNKRGGFTRRVGNFVVSGQYRQPGENVGPNNPNEFLLDGEAHVFFGGVDFFLSVGSDAFTITADDGTMEETLPERMLISADSVCFYFPAGAELEFATYYTGGSSEMRISAVFPEGFSGMELPFRPQRKSEIREVSDGQFIISADGTNYSFGRSPMDTERRVLLLHAGAGAISYRAIPEHETSSPDNFILPEAATPQAYNEVLTLWRDQNFSLWNRAVPEQNNEDLVIAAAGEALIRGTYKATVASVSQSFLRGNERTYESSVYLGNLEQAYRSLTAREREKLARLSRQINEKSLEFLLEPRVFEFFAVRGHLNFLEAGADLVKTIDPAVLALDLVPGILEGFVDWKTLRPGAGNPFERLVDQACFVVFESLRSIQASGQSPLQPIPAIQGDRIIALTENQTDTEFNLRLGKALLVYGEAVQNSSWAGIGRSLILSALSMGDAAATARLYRILSPVEPYPRAVALSEPPNAIWAWTAAQSVSAVQQNDALDITINFPAGETHYMLIRGIRPFARVQLYGMDFRSDPQFERYDSSGWVYYPQDQILVLKMRHRSADERVRIIFREEQRPAAAPAPAVPQPAAPAAAPAAPAPAVVPQPAAAPPPVITPPPAASENTAPPAMPAPAP